jgi:hypothetical protein
MVRSVLGVLVGAVLWMPVFFAIAVLLVWVWPDYAASARTWMEQGVFVFTAPQAACNIVFWILADIFAGWITLVIAKRREAGWVLAALLTLYLASLHIVLYWDRFPWWYNLAVVLSCAPAVLWGGKLAGRLGSRAAMPAAGSRA